MDKIQNQGGNAAQETIELLTNPNETSVCDETCGRFNEDEVLPPFYNAEKFRRGQKFFRKHLFAMLLGKLLGLMTVISTPNILAVLIYTKMSSESMTAYKRYMATILHMCVWYEDDFKPGSKLWRSVAAVKNLHNSASKRSCAAGSQRILQKDMGITQFGFMGYAIVCPQLIGIHNGGREDFEGFVHVWRVVGYLMGMEDKFNICSGSVAETREICRGLISKLFVPNIRLQNPEYLKMANALVTGMWSMQPMLETKAYMMFMYGILNEHVNDKESKIPEIELNRSQRFNLGLIKVYMYYLKYTLLRWYSNAKQIISFWLMRNFPFLAIYRYGLKNSYVSIHVERGNRYG